MQNICFVLDVEWGHNEMLIRERESLGPAEAQNAKQLRSHPLLCNKDIFLVSPLICPGWQQPFPGHIDPSVVGKKELFSTFNIFSGGLIIKSP